MDEPLSTPGTDGPETGFVRVIAVEELGADAIHRFLIDDNPRLLLRTEAGLSALDGICTHQHAELAEGGVDEGLLWCPRHGSGFDPETGEPVSPPALTPLRTYEVVVREGFVEVALEPRNG